MSTGKRIGRGGNPLPTTRAAIPWRDMFTYKNDLPVFSIGAIPEERGTLSHTDVLMRRDDYSMRRLMTALITAVTITMVSMPALAISAVQPTTFICIPGYGCQGGTGGGTGQ
jgi:hypothetical protein